jgi:hypothetical protein
MHFIAPVRCGACYAAMPEQLKYLTQLSFKHPCPETVPRGLDVFMNTSMWIQTHILFNINTCADSQVLIHETLRCSLY